jgi:hypothetical protein
MQKVKHNQRGREIAVYPWAMDMAQEIVGKTMFAGMVMPGTDLVLYWAEAITETFDSANKELGQLG